MNFLPVQIVIGLLTLGAMIYTVVGYPGRYGAVTGRSRLFRTVGVGIFDLLFLLVLLATFIDWKAEIQTAVTPRAAQVRFLFYVAACLLLCFALVCIAALDALESYSAARRERRITLEKMLRQQVEEARAEAAAMSAAENKANSSPSDNADGDT